MYLAINHEHRTYKVAVTNNSKPEPKTRTLSNGKVIPTWKAMLREIKNIE